MRITVMSFSPISFNIFFGCLKEPSHRDPQHMFWLGIKEKKIMVHSYTCCVVDTH